MNKKNILDALRSAMNNDVIVKLRLGCYPEKELLLKIVSMDDNGNIKGEEVEKRFFSFNIDEIVSDIGVCSREAMI